MGRLTFPMRTMANHSGSCLVSRPQRKGRLHNISTTTFGKMTSRSPFLLSCREQWTWAKSPNACGSNQMTRRLLTGCLSSRISRTSISSQPSTCLSLRNILRVFYVTLVCCLSLSFDLTFFSFVQSKPRKCCLALRVRMPIQKKWPPRLLSIERRKGITVLRPK